MALLNPLAVLVPMKFVVKGNHGTVLIQASTSA